MLTNPLVLFLEYLLTKLTGKTVDYIDDDIVRLNFNIEDLDYSECCIPYEYNISPEIINNIRICTMLYLKITKSTEFRQKLLKEYVEEVQSEEYKDLNF